MYAKKDPTKIMAELVPEPTEYCPKINAEGQYEDDIPNGSMFKMNKYRCPCKGFITNKRSAFKTHTASQEHRKWIAKLNTESKNYYSRFLANEQVLKQQQILLTEKDNMIQRYITEITRKDVELSEKSKEIRELKEIVKKLKKKKEIPTGDLLELDH